MNVWTAQSIQAMALRNLQRELYISDVIFMTLFIVTFCELMPVSC